MPKNGKIYRNIKDKLNKDLLYKVDEGLQFVLDHKAAKFDETIEVHAKLGVDPRHADQVVRGTVVLPEGLGKTVRVLVFAQADKYTEAKDAGADFVGLDDLVEKIQKENWFDFDVAIATPDTMSKVGRLGRLLGPRGLMPNPKSGTVTFDVGNVVKEFKAGKVEFRVDKSGVIHVPVGKASFNLPKVRSNFNALMEALMKARPASAKGRYLRTLTVCSTMGPGVHIDPNEITAQYR